MRNSNHTPPAASPTPSPPTTPDTPTRPRTPGTPGGLGIKPSTPQTRPVGSRGQAVRPDSRGNINYANSDITTLPHNLEVFGDLDLSNCRNLEKLPEGLVVHGKLILAGCTQISRVTSRVDAVQVDTGNHEIRFDELVCKSASKEVTYEGTFVGTNFTQGEALSEHYDRQGQTQYYTATKGHYKNGELSQGEKVFAIQNQIIIREKGKFNRDGTLIEGEKRIDDNPPLRGKFGYTTRFLNPSLGDLLFAGLLVGKAERGTYSPYAYDVIAAHFEQYVNSRSQPSPALHGKLTVLVDYLTNGGNYIDLPADQRRTYMQEMLNDPDLKAKILPLLPQQHAMAVKIEKSDHQHVSHNVTIYNSGAGLDHHIQAIINGKKRYQTAKKFAITRSMPDAMDKFVKLLTQDRKPSVDEIYQFLNQHGTAQLQRGRDQIWQTGQISGNCSVESLMAVLKNELGAAEYAKYRLQLLQDTREALLATLKTDTRLTKQEREQAGQYLEELNRKINKRAAALAH